MPYQHGCKNPHRTLAKEIQQCMLHHDYVGSIPGEHVKTDQWNPTWNRMKNENRNDRLDAENI